jgi:hypothetical protein
MAKIALRIRGTVDQEAARALLNILEMDATLTRKLKIPSHVRSSYVAALFKCFEELSEDTQNDFANLMQKSTPEERRRIAQILRPH